MGIFEKLQEINRLKEEADARMPQKDWDQAFLEKVKIEFTYNSNKIEGNTITYGQTVKLLKELVAPKNRQPCSVGCCLKGQGACTASFTD